MKFIGLFIPIGIAFAAVRGKPKVQTTGTIPATTAAAGAAVDGSTSFPALKPTRVGVVPLIDLPKSQITIPGQICFQARGATKGDLDDWCRKQCWSANAEQFNGPNKACTFEMDVTFFMPFPGFPRNENVVNHSTLKPAPATKGEKQKSAEARVSIEDGDDDEESELLNDLLKQMNDAMGDAIQGNMIATNQPTETNQSTEQLSDSLATLVLNRKLD